MTPSKGQRWKRRKTVWKRESRLLLSSKFINTTTLDLVNDCVLQPQISRHFNRIEQHCCRHILRRQITNIPLLSKLTINSSSSQCLMITMASRQFSLRQCVFNNEISPNRGHFPPILLSHTRSPHRLHSMKEVAVGHCHFKRTSTVDDTWVLLRYHSSHSTEEATMGTSKIGFLSCWLLLLNWPIVDKKICCWTDRLFIKI